MNIFPLSSDQSRRGHQPPPSPAPGPHGGLSCCCCSGPMPAGTRILPGEKVSPKDFVTTLITHLLLQLMIIFTTHDCLSRWKEIHCINNPWMVSILSSNGLHFTKPKCFSSARFSEDFSFIDEKIYGIHRWNYFPNGLWLTISTPSALSRSPSLSPSPPSLVLVHVLSIVTVYST